MAIRIEIKNLDRLIRAVERSPADAERELEAALDDAVGIISNLSLKRFGIVPYRHGFLSNSFELGKIRARLFRAIGPTVEYAAYVNYGTRYIKPRLYMEKLVERAKPFIDKRFEEVITRIPDRIAQFAD